MMFLLGKNTHKTLTACLAACLLGAPVAAEEIWVTNEKDDTISVIDVATLEVVRTIPTGDRPRGITFSHDHSVVYICASDSDTVQVMDPDTGEVLFVISRTVVAQIDVGIEPEGMAVSPDGKLAITTSETTNMAHWIDTETRELVANTLVDSRPRHAEFAAGGTQLWVSAEIGGTVSVFDVETKAELAKIDFAVKGVHPDRVQPVGFEFDGEEKTAFVALGPSNHVAVVNAETFEVEQYILVGRRVWHMAFNSDKSLLFTTNGISGDVTVIDVAKREAIKTIKVGRFPWGAALRP